MTEDEARQWFVDRYGVDATARVADFLALVIAENGRQNLIAPSTIDTIWARHAVDSAQLLAFGDRPGHWVDVGTGGGFPGMIVAILRDDATIMVEPRRKRADFLGGCIERLGLAGRASIHATKVEQVDIPASIISARAVAPVEKLLQATAGCATPTTRWILPRGAMETVELNALRRLHQDKMFHVEHSLTSPDSSILIVDRAR